MTETVRSLEEQRAEFKKRKFLAMPIAGTIVWLGIGIISFFLEGQAMMLTTFIGAGSIFYLGLLVARFTGENLLGSGAVKNSFDQLFIMVMVMALMVFAIAIPFAMMDVTSTPMSVGILTGLMWLPLSWSIQHWVGIFHAVCRTVLVLAVWYLLPDMRFTAIPFVVVAVYLVTLVILVKRWRHENRV